MNSGTQKRLKAFYDLICEFIDKNESLNAFELAQEVLKKSGIAHEAYQDLTPEGMSRSQNIQELLNAINEFVSTRQEQGEEEIGLVDFCLRFHCLLIRIQIKMRRLKRLL